MSLSAEALAGYEADLQLALEELERSRVVPRIWRGDHTVWSASQEDVRHRLGWLRLPDIMRGRLEELRAFAEEVRASGFRRVVLLGMGGSSLGARVLRDIEPASPDGLDLIVLDSTLPALVRRITGSTDPAATLFLVCSKSGDTVEPNALYRHFRSVVADAVGGERAGDSFVAITDAGTSLDALARAEGFRRVFLNPDDVGGRFSVLSYFGLVPGVLAGVDASALLDGADRMRSLCGPSVAVEENPGARLGATIGALAARGRDKLTLVAPPSLAGFALWVEQLIAESLGKQGRGPVPVVGEPPAPADAYGADRFFVYVGFDPGDESAAGSTVDGVERAGHPVVRTHIEDPYDLGGELFRWEIATAIAGSILDVNPFDEPDVQAAKEMTDAMLSGREGAVEGAAALSVGVLLSSLGPGDYLAIAAYLEETPDVDRALVDLRRRILRRFGVATTVGYGPRYLHSTGQLHKGGPASVALLQLTADHQSDVAVPGSSYTFAGLADAQAAGDLRALDAAGRRVARLHLGTDAASAIRGLSEEIDA